VFVSEFACRSRFSGGRSHDARTLLPVSERSQAARRVRAREQAIEREQPRQYNGEWLNAPLDLCSCTSANSCQWPTNMCCCFCRCYVTRKQFVTSKSVLGSASDAGTKLVFIFSGTRCTKKTSKRYFLFSTKMVLNVMLACCFHFKPRCIGSARPGIPNLSLTMYPFRIPTDEHVPLKFLMTKYFVVSNHRYISTINIMIFENKIH